MSRFSIALVAAFAFVAASFAESPPASVCLVVPTAHSVARWQLVFQVQGFDPDIAWTKFVDRWFDFFDRNGDGQLTTEEAACVLPVPGREGTGLAFDFVQADANKDRIVHRDELKRFYRDAGFKPIVAIVHPRSGECDTVSEAIFHRLDRGKQRKLTVADLARAADLLDVFDENHDEAITIQEVLNAVPLEPNPHVRGIHVDLEKSEAKASETILLTELGVFRKQLSETILAFDTRNLAWKGPARVTKSFCLAQFHTLRANKTHLDRKFLEGDPAARLVLSLFNAADRDGDGRLTLSEIERLLDLIEEGAACQLFLTVTDRGRNVFDSLDANGDARIDARELASAGKRLAPFLSAGSITWSQIPFSLQVTAQRGSMSPSFGPLPLTSAPPPPPIAIERVRKGPIWFQAMDQNHDGIVSVREFVGPHALFRRWDANSDGVLDIDEAQRAAEQADLEKR